MGEEFPERTYRYVICSGGGPGIMEAANRGAADARGKTIGLNIGLPFEQFPNPYITPSSTSSFTTSSCASSGSPICRRRWWSFPAASARWTSLFEILTLVQTQKLAKKITIILYGSQFLERDHQLRRAGEVRDHLRRRIWNGPRSQNRRNPQAPEWPVTRLVDLQPFRGTWHGDLQGAARPFDLRLPDA
jgi:hypothetical protein